MLFLLLLIIHSITVASAEDTLHWFESQDPTHIKNVLTNWQDSYTNFSPQDTLPSTTKLASKVWPTLTSHAPLSPALAEYLKAILEYIDAHPTPHNQIFYNHILCFSLPKHHFLSLLNHSLEHRYNVQEKSMNYHFVLSPQAPLTFSLKSWEFTVQPAPETSTLFTTLLNAFTKLISHSRIGVALNWHTLKKALTDPATLKSIHPKLHVTPEQLLVTNQKANSMAFTLAYTITENQDWRPHTTESQAFLTFCRRTKAPEKTTLNFLAYCSTISTNPYFHQDLSHLSRPL